MIYKQVFSLKQYAAWLALNRAVFQACSPWVVARPPCGARENLARSMIKHWPLFEP